VDGFRSSRTYRGAALIRKNHSEYPATKDRPAYVHDDLVVMYVDSSTKQTRAFYLDGESHVINYTGTVSADGNTFTFLSDLLPSAPRYRLTYIKTQPDALTISFEIAPPGKPDEFARYITATARRPADSK
jgi:hypothetical protein